MSASRAGIALSDRFAGFQFDPAFHRYFVDGREMLSVTQVLRESGLVEFEFYHGGGPGGVLARKAALGRAVHEATHYLDEGDLDWSSIDPEVWPYVHAYLLMLRETGFVPILVEYRVYHPRFNYCGTLDKLGTIDRYPYGVLLDLKTGDPDRVCTNLQTAAYLDAYLAAPDARVLAPGARIPPTFERWSVQLRADSTYRLCRYSDHRDLGIFRAALALVQYKRRGGHQ